jgi:hypothetical protein
VGLELGPLSLVSTIEELLERNTQLYIWFINAAVRVDLYTPQYVLIKRGVCFSI